MCIPKFEKLENGACAQQILKIRDTRARVLKKLKNLETEACVHLYFKIGDRSICTQKSVIGDRR